MSTHCDHCNEPHSTANHDWKVSSLNAEIERLRADNKTLFVELERIRHKENAANAKLVEALKWYASVERPADEYSADCGERARAALVETERKP